MTTIKQNIFTAAVAIATIMAPTFASAAQLSSDAKTAIPKDVQQLIVVDYRAMQNSTAAMDLKDRVLPPNSSASRPRSRAPASRSIRMLTFSPSPPSVIRQGREPASSASPRASSTPARSWPTSPRTRSSPHASQQQHLPHGLQRHERRLPQPDHDGLRRYGRGQRSDGRPRRHGSRLPLQQRHGQRHGRQSTPKPSGACSTPRVPRP